jgi:hypothetical protein
MPVNGRSLCGHHNHPLLFRADTFNDCILADPPGWQLSRNGREDLILAISASLSRTLNAIDEDFACWQRCRYTLSPKGSSSDNLTQCLNSPPLPLRGSERYFVGA